MKKLFFTIALSIGVLFAGAQDYNTAVGLSLGGNMGINVKQRVSRVSAIEAGVDYAFSHDQVNFFAVWQYHFPLTDELSAYAGAGFNLGASHVNSSYWGSEFAFGLDPNIGIEYQFDSAPISIGFDYRPMINLTTCSSWSSASLKLRYIF